MCRMARIAGSAAGTQSPRAQYMQGMVTKAFVGKDTRPVVTTVTKRVGKGGFGLLIFGVIVIYENVFIT